MTSTLSTGVQPWEPDMDSVEFALLCARTGWVAICRRVTGVQARAFHLPEQWSQAVAWVRHSAGPDTTISVLPATLTEEGARRINGSLSATGPQVGDVGSYELVPLDLDPPKHLDQAERGHWWNQAVSSLAAFPLPPSIVVHSGNGLHAYWLLIAPASVEAARLVIEDLARALDGDKAAANPTQHLRLAGTFNPKVNVRRLAVLDTFESQRKYGLDDIAKAAQAISPRPAPWVPAPRRMVAFDGGPDWTSGYRNQYDLAAELDRVAGPANRAGKWRCPAHPDSTPSLGLVKGSDDRAICFGEHPEDMGRRSGASGAMSFDVLDLHAWEAGQTVADFMRAERERQHPKPARPAKQITTSESPQPGQEAHWRRGQVTWADTITMRPVVWAWTDDGEGRIPTGSLSIAAGREGTGKSTFGIWLAAQITRGTLHGNLHGKPRNVLYVAVEDSWAHTLAPRLAAAGADLAKVGRFDVIQSDAEDEVILTLPHDNKLLEAAINEHNVGLVVMDPLMSLLGDGIETNNTRSVRKALDPLVAIANRTGCLMLGIAHFNKGSGTDPSSLITGSGAFKDVPRSVFGFVRDGDAEDGSRVMTQTKNSLGRDELPSLKYLIEDAVVDTPEGPAHVGKLTWQGTSDRTAQEILRDSVTGMEDREDREDAAAWLRSYLLDNASEAEANDVYKAGKAAGFSKDSLKRAKKKAGAASIHGPGMTAGWVWRLTTSEDEGSAEGSEGSGPRTPAPFAPFALPSSLQPEMPADCRSCGWPSDSSVHDQTCGKESA